MPETRRSRFIADKALLATDLRQGYFSHETGHSLLLLAYLVPDILRSTNGHSAANSVTQEACRALTQPLGSDTTGKFRPVVWFASVLAIEMAYIHEQPPDSNISDMCPLPFGQLLFFPLHGFSANGMGNLQAVRLPLCCAFRNAYRCLLDKWDCLVTEMPCGAPPFIMATCVL